jgi:hypothetical protein
MSRLTTDRNDPELGRGIDATPVGQNPAYLVLSDEELAKGLVRPIRTTYVHVGATGPNNILRELTPEQHEQYDKFGYVKYEAYPVTDDDTVIGRFWTQEQLDKVGSGCDTATTMSIAIAETYAVEPGFYGSTYCVGCSKHLPVNEFVWSGTQERVGS